MVWLRKLLFPPLQTHFQRDLCSRTASSRNRFQRVHAECQFDDHRLPVSQDKPRTRSCRPGIVTEPACGRSRILQGLAPTIWGSLSDHLGRRIIFLATLSLYIGACIGLALTPTSAFWLLMLLRCIQSAGGSSVIAIGAGCVSDIATREERAGYLGIFSAGTMIGPTSERLQPCVEIFLPRFCR